MAGPYLVKVALDSGIRAGSLEVLRRATLLYLLLALSVLSLAVVVERAIALWRRRGVATRILRGDGSCIRSSVSASFWVVSARAGTVTAAFCVAVFVPS